MCTFPSKKKLKKKINNFVLRNFLHNFFQFFQLFFVFFFFFSPLFNVLLLLSVFLLLIAFVNFKYFFFFYFCVQMCSFFLSHCLVGIFSNVLFPSFNNYLFITFHLKTVFFFFSVVVSYSSFGIYNRTKFWNCKIHETHNFYRDNERKTQEKGICFGFAAEGKRCPDQTEKTVSMAMEILPHSRNLATLKLENK